MELSRFLIVCASAHTFVFCAYAHGICFPLCAFFCFLHFSTRHLFFFCALAHGSSFPAVRFFVFYVSERAFKKRASTQPRRKTMRLSTRQPQKRFSAGQLLIFALHRPAIVQFSTKFLPKHPPNGLPRMIG